MVGTPPSMRISRRLIVSLGVGALAGGIALMVGAGDSWTPTTIARTALLATGTWLLVFALQFEPFDPQLDERLRAAAPAASVSGCIRRRLKLPTQCIYYGDADGLVVLESRGERRVSWTDMRSIKGNVGGPGRTIYFRTSRWSHFALSVRREQRVVELLESIPRAPHRSVRLWESGAGAAVMGGATAVASVGWAAWALYGFQYCPLIGITFLPIAAWGGIAAVQFGKQTGWSFTSSVFLALNGLPLAIWMATSGSDAVWTLTSIAFAALNIAILAGALWAWYTARRFPGKPRAGSPKPLSQPAG